MAAAGEWRDAAGRLDRATVESVRGGAALLRARLLAGYAADMGGDLQLSGGGGPISIAIDLTEGAALSSATVRAVGRPARWLESGTGPRRRQGGSSPARRTFSRAVAVGGPVAVADMKRRLGSAI